MARPWEKRWKLCRPLGKGGQGETYLVTLKEDDTIEGALKHLRNDRDVQARGRMRREVANLQTLASAGGTVPRILDHNTDQFENHNVELFVVMDLIQGPTLADYVSELGPMALDDAIRFTLSITSTLKVAHTFPILHRDLKPQNIIVRDAINADLVVVDFGLSFNADDTTLTELNETFRNRFLDLPETNTPSGDRRDPRSDITAACGVLYYCLTGHPPGHLQDAAGDLPHQRKGFSPRERHSADARLQLIDDILTRGFAPSIANRFQSVDELHSQLQSLTSGGQHLDLGDPVQLAASLSQLLRTRDRRTQLANFQRSATTIFDRITAELSKYQGKLDQFDLRTRVFIAAELSIPVGLDLVCHFPTAIVLNAQHHEIERRRHYVVASQGERCVLLAADYESRPTDPVSAPLSWREVVWYDGEPESIMALVSISLREWVVEQLAGLTKRILRSTQIP